jgi:hypothetical protein
MSVRMTWMWAVQQGLEGHLRIVAAVLERNGPFVTPEDVQLRPVDLLFIRGGGQDLMEAFRCTAAREGDGKPGLSF